MFGATAVRQKRERERRERRDKGMKDGSTLPYIKPFGASFNKYDLPYFKYRETIHLSQCPYKSNEETKDREGEGQVEKSEESSKQTLLFIGLGLFGIGFLISTVGLGDKGFKTFHCKLMGPVIIIAGLILVMIALLWCWLNCLLARRKKIYEVT